jgi:hypothetical protein
MPPRSGGCSGDPHELECIKKKKSNKRGKGPEDEQERRLEESEKL